MRSKKRMAAASAAGHVPREKTKMSKTTETTNQPSTSSASGASTSEEIDTS